MKTPPSPSVPYAPLPRRQGGGPSPGPPLNALSGETAGGPPDAERGRQDFERQGCQSLHQIGTRLLFQSCTQGCVFIKTAGVHGDPRGWGSWLGRGGGAWRGASTGVEDQDRKRKEAAKGICHFPAQNRPKSHRSQRRATHRAPWLSLAV